MKFVIDAQISFKLSKYLSNKGYDVVHVIELPEKDKTTDINLMKFADNQSRVLITKDRDFVDSYFIRNTPKKLLYLTTGNTNNQTLFDIFEKNLMIIDELFITNNYIELSIDNLIVHE